MNDFEKLKNEMKKGDNSENIKSLVGSEEAKRISKMINSEELKKAAVTGDKEKLESILGKVLNTDEGKVLLKKIGEKFESNP